MKTIDHVAVVAPRVLGLATAGFFAFFMFDSIVFQFELPIIIAVTALALAPALIVLMLVLLGWHKPFAGGLGFLGASTLYSLMTVRLRLEWTAAIAGPLIVVGLAFLWRWQRRPRLGETG